MKITLTPPNDRNKIEILVSLSGVGAKSDWTFFVPGFVGHITVSELQVNTINGISYKQFVLTLFSTTQITTLQDAGLSTIELNSATSTAPLIVKVICLEAKQSNTVLSAVFENTELPLVYVTSKPYPVRPVDEMNVSLGRITFGKEPPLAEFDDSLDVENAAITGGKFSGDPQYYSMEPELLDVTLAELIGGAFKTSNSSYGMLPENLDVTLAEITSGTLKLGKISYSNWIVESLDVTLPETTGGTLV